MIKKKSLTALLSVMALTMCVAGASALAAQDDYEGMPQKTVNANVAQYKTVTTDAPFIETGYGAEFANDGNMNTTFILGLGTGNYVQLDLKRSYKLTKLELVGRYGMDHADMRHSLKVIASNDADFSEFDVLDELSASDSDRFPYQGAWEINLNSGKYYRYIRVVRTGAYAYGGFGEIRAYADMNVTEVSRNKTATGNWWYETCNYDWASPQTVLDGNEAYMEAWISYKEGANATGYNWLQVDLGDEYNIGYIEMSGRPEDAGAESMYQAFDFYGSDFAVETDEQKNYLLVPGATEGLSYADEAHGYYTLSSLATADRFVSGFASPDYPMSVAKPYCVAVDDSTAYRYITYKHTWPLGSMIGKLGLFVINPEAIGAELNGNTFSVSFSDEMNFDGVSEKLTLKNSAGNTIAISNVTPQGTKLSFDAVLENGEVYTISVPKIENQNGVPMMEDGASYSFQTPPAIEVKQFYYTPDKEAEGAATESLSGLTELGVKAVVKNNTTSKTETAVILMTVYDANGFFVTSAQAKETIGAGEEKPLKTGLTLPVGSGYTVKTFLWKNFTGMTSWSPLKRIN